MTLVLAAGDHFVLNRLLVEHVEREVPGSEVRELTLSWPHTPFGAVAEVTEASGSEEEMVEALRGVEVCVTQMAPLTERVLEACPDLRLFCVGRGGPVNVNLAAAAEHGVVVTAAPGRNAVATAEHTIALMLAAARRVAETHVDLTAGTWRGDYYAYDRVGPEVAGSTVGLVGFGAIGRLVAAGAAALGARVLVHDPYVDAASVDADGVTVVPDLDALLAESDFVSVHARATPETEGLLSADRLARMRPGAVLVNCARGSLVDYDAVCDALDRGDLFAAAFDVFPEEPVPKGSRLLSTPGLTLTPHVAGASRATATNAARMVAAEVGRYVRGEEPLHPVSA